MPHSPDDPELRNDALDHLVKNLFDVELERLAFGRPRTEVERRKAAAAVRELARRTAQHAQRSGDVVSPGASIDAVASAGRAPSRRAWPAVTGESDRGPWWKHAWVAVVAGILTLMVVTTVVPPLAESVSGPASLDVFDREATDEELDLRADMLREGLRFSVTPRVITRDNDARFLAYRLVVRSSAERPRSEICLLLADEEGLGWPSCTDRSDFVRGGIQTTLTGRSARYIVQWGPTGSPSVTVLPDSAPAAPIPASAAALPFFAGTPSEDDTAYAVLLRTLYPDDRLLVRVLDSTEGWDAVGALVATVDTRRWSYCVHLFERTEEARDQLGASVTCVGLEPFERDGLVARASGTESSIQLEWRPDGTVLVDESARG